MVSSSNIVSHILKDTTDWLTDNGTSQMTNVHLFGDVGWWKVDHNFLFLYDREGKF